MDEVQQQIQASLAAIQQDRVSVHNLAEHVKNSVPQLSLDAFESSIKKLQLEFRTQGFKAAVRTFSREGARKFADWLKDMKKVSTLVDEDDDRLRSLALETLQESAADFLSRKIKAKPNITFSEIKKI